MPQLADPWEGLVFRLNGIFRTAKRKAEADGVVDPKEAMHLGEIAETQGLAVRMAAKRKAMQHFERMETPTEYTAQLFALTGFAIAPLDQDPQLTTTFAPALADAR